MHEINLIILGRLQRLPILKYFELISKFSCINIWELYTKNIHTKNMNVEVEVVT